MPPEDSPRIDTGGGAYIAGDVYTGGGDFIGGDNYEIHPPSREDARARRDQLILLEKVRRFWIQGVLEKSLHTSMLIQVGMETLPGMVDHPWETVVELPEQDPAPLSPEKHIADVFEEAGRTLLILGAPGSGKTITLLELARVLLDWAEADPARPVPVVLNLSTWAERRGAFDDWLVTELNAKYQIPKKVGRDWLEHNEVLPLLDGLDELPASLQDDCVAAINSYGVDHGLSGLAVCSRTGDYRGLEVKLKMSAAIHLQPLSARQVTAYLESAGPSLAGLTEALAHDPALLELAQTPLMLSAMALAYRDEAPEAPGVAASNLDSRRKQIFDGYLRRVFARKADGRHFAAEKQLGWLAWLARGMETRNLSLFLIEGLQPDWLGSRPKIRLYIYASRILSGLLLGLGITVLGIDNFLELLLGPLLGAVAGLIVAIVTARQFGAMRPSSSPQKNQKSWRERLPAVGLSVGIPAGLLAGLWGFVDLSRFIYQDLADFEQRYRLLGALGAGITGAFVATLLIGVFIGLIFELIFGRRLSWQRPQEDIRTVDALKWSWGEAFRVALRGAGVGALVGPVVGIPIGLASAGEPVEMILTVPLGCCISIFLFGLLGALIGFVLGGLRGVDIPQKNAPNQGIWLSARNALIAGGLIGLILGLVSAIFTGEPLAARLGKLLSGLPIGFMVAVFFGILDFVQHFTLRFFLWRGDCMPWRYARFLDQAADLIILRKVGGGYIFVHRLLQEHIATMDLGKFLAGVKE